jgi:2-C-methyl-D-erythritol 4-phosphate cytidylyltransferase
MNTAIIAAAGKGSRFNSARPKQFLELLGKPLIIHTLERFEASDAIDRIVLVLSDNGRGEFDRIKDDFDISKLSSIVSGGQTRAESVCNGLNAVDASSANVVAVHDSARPLVSVDEITRTIETAAETGAACLVADVTDTIKEIIEGHVLRTVDRSRLRRALTPQAFRYDILKKAFNGADLTASITDECYLVEKLGIKIALVEGSPRNIKITRPEDLILAGALIEADLRIKTQDVRNS